MGVSYNGGTQQPWVFLLKMIILGFFLVTWFFLLKSPSPVTSSDPLVFGIPHQLRAIWISWATSLAIRNGLISLARRMDGATIIAAVVRGSGGWSAGDFAAELVTDIGHLLGWDSGWRWIAALQILPSFWWTDAGGWCWCCFESEFWCIISSFCVFFHNSSYAFLMFPWNIWSVSHPVMLRILGKNEACENRFKFVSAQHQYVSKKDENDKVPRWDGCFHCEWFLHRLVDLGKSGVFWVRFLENNACQYSMIFSIHINTRTIT